MINTLLPFPASGAFQGKWNKQIQMNIVRLRIQLVGGQPVGYLQAWPRISTRDDREQIQQVARAGLEPGTAGLRVRSPDHIDTLRSSFAKAKTDVIKQT